LTNKLTKSELIVSQNDSVVNNLKSKLKESYREFVDLTSDYDNLSQNSTSIEALHATQKQVEAMAVQYTSVTRDLISVSKNYEERTLKLRQLEFECEELVRQFNTLGQSNTKLQEAHEKLTDIHDIKMVELSKLTLFCGGVVRAKDVAEDGLQELTHLHGAYMVKSGFEKEDANNKIAKLQAYVSQLEIENGGLKKSLDESTVLASNRHKKIDEIDVLFKSTVEKYVKECETKDKKIHELQYRENDIGTLNA